MKHFKVAHLIKALLCAAAIGAAQFALAADPVWIDVRSAEEYAEQHHSEAINIEFTEIVAGVTEAGIAKDAEILLYCGSGRRAGIAQQALQEAGYSNVVNRGGLADVLND